MPSKLQTESGRGSGVGVGRVDSLSVSDALIVLAAAHRLCEERDSLRRVYMKELERSREEVERRMWIERVGFGAVVLFMLIVR